MTTDNRPTTDVPGLCGTNIICTCSCHGQDTVMHCAPCCDKTYEMYSPELWECIPELQAALDEVQKKIQSAAVVDQSKRIHQ